MFDCPQLSDVVVRVGDRRFHLHKLLLMRSPVLRVMLLGQQWQDSRRPEVVLEELEACAPHMEDFLRYFYTAQVDLRVENVLALLLLANKYDVGPLQQACEQYALASVFRGTDMDIIFCWFTMAEQLGLAKLYKKTRDYISLNMDLAMQCDQFKDLGLSHLRMLLGCTDMVVSSEVQLFGHLLLWLGQDERKDDLVDNLKALAPLIKFTQMAPDDLLNIEQYMSRWPDALQVLQPHIVDAFKFHSMSFRARRSHNLVAGTSPRLYVGTKGTDSRVCKSIRVSPQSKSRLQAGICEKFSVPISLSTADRAGSKPWQYSFREVEGSLCLEICTVLEPDEPFDMVETSFLIYRHINGITFVKGVMQLRGFVQMAPSGAKPERAGHVFTVMVPPDALEKDSSYQIPDETGTRCQFKMVMRHYAGSEGSPKSKTPQETQVIINSAPRAWN